ncbi:MAG: hypothetical protein ABWX84_07540 [Nocardioides sp.]
MSDEHPDSPQGPVDPHGQGGIDAPAPPGGPQRTDAPETSATPGENAPDPDPDPGSDPGAGQIPEPVGDASAQQDEQERSLQEENAETSLDQPSG